MMLKRRSGSHPRRRGSDNGSVHNNVPQQQPPASITEKQDLDAPHVESLIMNLCEASHDSQLAALYKKRFQGLTARHCTSNNKHNHWQYEELEELLQALQALLASIPTPSSCQVAQVHSTMGLMYSRLHQDARAKQSFLQALWVQSSSQTSPTSLGLTRTRLALTSGRQGQVEEAVALLQLALQDFQHAQLPENHDFVVQAKEALQAFQSLQLMQHQKQQQQQPRHRSMDHTSSTTTTTSSSSHVPRSIYANSAPPMMSRSWSDYLSISMRDMSSLSVASATNNNNSSHERRRRSRRISQGAA